MSRIRTFALPVSRDKMAAHANARTFTAKTPQDQASSHLAGLWEAQFRNQARMDAGIGAELVICWAGA